MFTVVKKTALTALAVFALVVSPLAGSSVIAVGGATFNTDPNDRPTIRVTNYTRNSECNTCWSYETAAKVGDTVSFDVYYHNTSDITAENTTASVSLNVSGSYIGATGRVDATNSVAATGNANVNLDASGYTNIRATFVSASWYPNRSASGQSISASDGSASIGDIGPGWDTQGHVVFRYKIEGDQQGGGGNPPTGNQSVYGYHDGNAGAQSGLNCKAFGWAADPDSPNTPVTVKIYIDGQFKGMEYQMKADLFRSDVKQANMPGCSSGNCAFSKQLTLTPGPHNITAYAIDLQTNAMVPLHTTDKAIECDSGPAQEDTNVFGWHEREEGNQPADKCIAAGWATDPNGGGAVNVRISADGNIVRSTRADLARGDLAGNCKNGVNCAFVENLSSVLQAGRTYTIRAEAQDRETGQWRDLGWTNKRLTCGTPDTGPTCPAPTVTTGSAMVIGTDAIVSGTVSGNGKAATFWVEYGLSPDRLDQKTTERTGSGNVEVTINTYRTGTTFYYRFVVKTECGTKFGDTRFFRTDSGPTNECTQVTATTGNFSNLTQTSVTLAGSVTGNPSTSLIQYRRVGDSAWLTAGTGTSVNLGNLTPNTTYEYRMFATSDCNTAFGTPRQFTTTGTQCTPPTASTGDAYNITASSATVSGSVTGNSTGQRFEYRRVGDSAWITVSYNSGTATLSGLNQSTTYEYRVVADSNCGTINGTIRTFTTTGTQCTPPSVSTGDASNVTANSATVSGTVSGNSISQRFEYRRAGDSSWISVSYNNGSATLNGLSQSTTYEYRVVADSNCGTINGTIRTFTTSNIQCTPPSASTGDAYNISTNSATITGSVTGNSTGQRFEYRRAGDSSWISVGYNGGTANLSGLTAGITYEYRVVADSNCGTVNGNVRNFQTSGGTQQCTAPFASTGYATVLSDTSVRLTGSATNASTVRFEYRRQGDYSWQTAGFGNSVDLIVVPNVTYEYRLFAQNSCDTAVGSVLTFRTGGQTPVGQRPTVITRDATNRSATTALLNGTVNPNGGATTSWFEWSSSASVVASGGGTRVPVFGQPAGSGYAALDYNAQIFGLTSGGTYYFRAAASNPNGTAYGEILRIGPFSTGGGGGGVVVTQPPIIVTTLAGGATGSCLTLTPSLNGQLLPGGEFVYGITYRNDCPFDLQNTTLRNIIPNEVEFGNTNYPFLTRDLNVITYSLGTVPRNFQATILVRGIVKPTVRIGDTLIFRSELSFTDPQGRFQTISSMLPAAVGAATIEGATGQVLGASIFDTLGGLFTSGWFWFLLFLLLLGLFILWLATRNRGEEHEHE